MIVFGDLACPDRNMAFDLKRQIDNSHLFDNKIILGNLEGMIFEDGYHDKRYKLYNCESVINIFEKAKKTFLSFANNHAYDYPERILPTKNFLEKNEIDCAGIVENDGSIRPINRLINGKRFIIHAHCWDVMTKVLPNETNGIRINSCSYENLIGLIQSDKKKYPDAFIIAYMHWSHDMEKLPFPSHRVLAKDLIDSGAGAVLGSHSHCVTGGEIYHNGIIIYGLGNFFIPDNFYSNGKINYPEQCHNNLVIELNEDIGKSCCYWLKTYSIPKVKIELIKKENFDDGELIISYSPFRGMSDDEYLKYFKKHRSKSLFVPIYKTYRNTQINKINDFLSIKRKVVFRKMKQLLKKM